MQSRIAEFQVSLQQGSSDEKTIREEISRMNLRQVEIMDAVVEIQEYILGKQEALLAQLRERKSQKKHWKRKTRNTRKIVGCANC